MYDTMKDRRIGIAEVIEKFGVPPEKVVEVQALAGDSTDNVPGVPGIGIKTAAQLIVEYGDLETLLARAGEIKQPKRRETLLENAEKARISRQLVLLDDKVKLDVPLDDLAVHEPDARKLIAFLKAMEFSTLTRRVAEYSQIDPSDVAADDGNTSAAQAAPPPRPLPGGDLFDARRRRPRPILRRKREASAPPSKGATATARTRRQASRARRVSLAAARAEAARKTPVDRSKYQTIRSLDELNAWIARVARRRALRDRGQGELDRSDAGRDVAASRWRSAPNDACYVPLAHKAVRRRRRPVRRRARAGPDQGRRRASTALKPLLESAGHSEDRLQHQVQRRDAGAARHHPAQS